MEFLIAKVSKSPFPFLFPLVVLYIQKKKKKKKEKFNSTEWKVSVAYEFPWKGNFRYRKLENFRPRKVSFGR